MKLPSTSAGAFAPSGNSFASTYPGLLGSRVGGVGRSVRRAAGGDCDEIGFRTTKLTNSVTIRERGTGVMCPFCGIPNTGEKRFLVLVQSIHYEKLRTIDGDSPVSSQLPRTGLWMSSKAANYVPQCVFAAFSATIAIVKAPRPRCHPCCRGEAYPGALYPRQAAP
jgi:hypothetical protein